MQNSIEVSMNLRGRPAYYEPNKYAAKRIGVAEGSKLNVEALGLFQVADGDDIGPYFVIELGDGRVYYANVTEIRFADVGERVHFGWRRSK